MDAADFAILNNCLTGPDIETPTGCEAADLDLDVDVDLADFALFQLKFGTGL